MKELVASEDNVHSPHMAVLNYHAMHGLRVKAVCMR